MFNYLFGMMGNYESRKVARHEFENGDFISTCYVTDNEKYPYETAISMHCYDDGEIHVIKQYETKEEAMTGHEKIVNKFVNEPPAEIKSLLPEWLKCLGSEEIITRNCRRV